MTSPQDPHSRVYSHINGPAADLLDRLAVSEICKGWPVYRDASEWKNFRSLFAPKAMVWTTWSGVCDIDEFIEISKLGKKDGILIQHRECGTLVELGPVMEEDDDEDDDGGDGEGDDDDDDDDGEASVSIADHVFHDYQNYHHYHHRGGPPPPAPLRCTRRAIGKMKATITQRFVNPDDGVEFDVDCDCRFVFFCERVVGAGAGAAAAAAGQGGAPYSSSSSAPAWRAVYVKLIYEKDKIVPADGHTVPRLTAEERQYMRDSLPEGYRYLGVMQRRVGYTIDEKLATPRNAGWERMYSAMEAWLAGGKATLT